MHNHLFKKLDITEKVETIDYIESNLDSSNNLSKHQIINTLGVAKSTYYSVKNHVKSKGEIRRDEVKEQIFSIYRKYNGIYGAPKIHNEIIKNKKYQKISKRTISVYMKQMSIRSIVVPKFKMEDTSKQELPYNLPFVNYIKHSKPTQPHTHILTDITYIYTIKNGWTYLLTFMDMYTRKILAWDLNTEMTAKWVCKILEELLNRYKNIVYIHSDRGCQYTSKLYLASLLENNIAPSFSAKGYPYHNAWIESFHAQLKKECIYRRTISTSSEAKQVCFSYIEGFYNTIRSQEALGYLSPNKYEKLHSKCNDTNKLVLLRSDQKQYIKLAV